MVDCLLHCFVPQERHELLESNHKEINTSLDSRRQAEADFTEQYLAAVERFQAQIEELRIADAEDYHVLKIK